MAASDISRHFQGECGHHSVSCPKCFAVILCNDVCWHLKSACERKATPLGIEDAPGPCNTIDKAYPTSFQLAMEKQATEGRKYLDRMSLDVATYSDRINEVCHGVNTLKESLKDELAAGRKQNFDLLAKSVFDISVSNNEVKTSLVTLNDKINHVSSSLGTSEKTLFDQIINATSEIRDHFSQVTTLLRSEAKENTETAVEKVREFLGHAQLQGAYSIFTLNGVKALQQKAMQTGWAEYSTEKVYLRGYCLSPGVHLEKKGESLNLHAWIRLYKGDMDNFVQWPFQNKVRLCLVRHKNGSKLEFQVCGRHSDEFFQKPTQLKNKSCYFSGGSLDMNTIITDGYVENDNLIVKWELLPL